MLKWVHAKMGTWMLLKGFKSPPNGHCPSQLAEKHQHGKDIKEVQKASSKEEGCSIFTLSLTALVLAGVPPFFYVLF